MELVAGLLVAVAALAYILEPLTHHPRSISRDGFDQPPPDADALVRKMRKRITTVCPACRTASPPGHAFCVKCGRILLS